jgi:deoxyadenosine/deoxycytidine kinase
MPAKIVEIVGCAGVGKSTVAARLADGCSRFQVFTPSKRYTIQCWKYAILRLPRLVFLRLKGVRRHYLKSIIRAEAGLSMLQWHKNRGVFQDKVLLVDQGPLSRLAYLYFKGIPNKFVEKWLERLQQKAVGTFQTAVWLDAPNETLQVRLNGRGNGHKMENMPKQTVEQFYDTYRTCYGKVINGNCSNTKIPHIYIDSSMLSVQEVCNIIRKSA